jgi:hypothetical protein
MKTSTFVVISFLGLIFLAASLIWMPINNESAIPAPPNNAPDNFRTAGIDTSTKTTKAQPETAEPTATAAAEPSTEKTNVAISSSKNTATATPQSQLEFPTWPKPAIAIIVTGEQHGYFEPCGCTANQLGGMSRRAGFVEKLKSMGWTVRGVDAGDLSRRTGPQAQIKFDTTLKALRQLEYVAVALGPEELRFDPSYLLSFDTNSGDVPLKLLGANLTFYGDKAVGMPADSAIFEAGGIKIGVTSVMSETIRREVIPDRTEDENAAADLAWSDPAVALKRVLKDFEKEKVAIRILLSQATLEDSRKFAADFPVFDIIVAANGFGEGVQKAEMIGKSRMIQVGEKGKMAGLIGLYPDDEENPVRFELVALTGERFPDSESMITLMQDYQGQLKDQSIVTAESAIGHPSGASFVGASKCGECHTKAFEIWKGTAHAHAFESLEPANQREGFDRLHGVSRTFDPECLACHVTGWDPKEYARFDSGFLNQEFASDEKSKTLHELLSGNQCENCHGPGSQHVALIEAGNNEAAAKLMKVTLDTANTVTCRKCHDLDNSPAFQFEEYWEQVKHYGKD